MINVIEAAPHRRLTTPAAVRAAERDDGTDEVLLPLISAASAAIEAFLGRVLARERVREVFLPTRAMQRLPLARWPISEVVEVIEDGRILAPSDVQVDAAAGMLQRLAGGRASAATWMPVRIEVECLAGYALDGDDRDLPAEIERVAFDLVRRWRHGSRRDPQIQSLSIDEVLNVSYFSSSGNAIPLDLAEMLSPYRVPLVA